MDIFQILIICASLVLVAGGGAFAYVWLGGNSGAANGEMRGLMTGVNSTGRLERLAEAEQDPYELTTEEILKRTAGKKGDDQSLDAKLFRAGYYTAADRASFTTFRIVIFFVFLITFPAVMFFMTGQGFLTLMGVIFGAFAGFAYPTVRVERKIVQREEEIMYFLPLVIEQISIGVSSALDVGPCISNIIEMATERESHNVVTEMFTHVEKLMKSGLNLEDSLHEVSQASGMMQVKHAFMFLSQCSKHGGEVSKQLQELADSVSTERQVAIEAKIVALPVKATGPLAMVFAGFFALLFAGLMVRLMSAFGA